MQSLASHVFEVRVQRLLRNGMPKIGGELDERLENEAALQHSGMGNRQVRRFDDVLSVEQDVQVDGARALGASSAHSTSFPFHAQENGEELQREVAGLADGNDIQKPGLVFEILRFGFVEGGDSGNLDVLGVEAP